MAYSPKKEKIKPYRINDLKSVKRAIFILDSYRALTTEDFRELEKDVRDGKLGKGFESEWREIKKTLRRMAKIPKSQKRLLNLAALQQILINLGITLGMFSLTIMIIGILAMIGRWTKFIPLINQILRYIGIPLLIVLVIIFIGPPLIARKLSDRLEEYYRKRKQIFKEELEYLKNVVQRLIYGLRDFVLQNKEKLKAKQIEFYLYNTDYNGIMVIKQPARLRPYYTAIPIKAESKNSIIKQQ